MCALKIAIGTFDFELIGQPTDRIVCFLDVLGRLGSTLDVRRTEPLHFTRDKRSLRRRQICEYFVSLNVVMRLPETLTPLKRRCCGVLVRQSFQSLSCILECRC